MPILHLLLRTRLCRRSHSHRGRGGHGLLIGGGVVLLENRAEMTHALAGALLLRELANLDLGQVAGNRLLYEGIGLGVGSERER